VRLRKAIGASLGSRRATFRAIKSKEIWNFRGFIADGVDQEKECRRSVPLTRVGAGDNQPIEKATAHAEVYCIGRDGFKRQHDDNGKRIGNDSTGNNTASSGSAPGGHELEVHGG